MTRDRTPLRVFVVGIGLIVLALGLDRLLLKIAARHQPPEVLQQLTHERLTVAAKRIPEVAKTASAVVFGSSPIQWGFSPSIFDTAMADGGVTTTTFNMGIFAIGPDLMLVLARRLTAALHDQGRRLRVAVVEFTPFNATLARSDDVMINAMGAAQRARLSDAAALLGIARRSFTEASELLALKAWGDLPPQAAMIIYNRVVLQPITQLGVDKRSRLIRDAGARARVNSQGEAWNLSRRGEVVLRDPAKPADYDAWLKLHQSPEFMREDLAWRVNTSDIRQLHFAEPFIANYIALVRQMHEVSDDVVVMVAPCHPDARPATREARARLDAVLERISREGNVKVIDFYEDPAFVPYDFMDNTHMNDSTGKAKMSRKIAERILPLLTHSHTL